MWNSRLDYTGFLAGYSGECLPQNLHVIETDIGDNGQNGIEYVRSVKPPPKTCLDDCNLDARSGEVIEAQRGD